MARTREELEHALAEADRRNGELRAEIDEQRDLISKLREQIEDDDALLEQWVPVFAMPLDEKGDRVWTDDLRDQLADVDRVYDEYAELVRDWNRLVTKWNATGLVKPAHRGRPLDASSAQEQQVR